MMENKTVYLNGQYLPLNEAKVSVLDRGFLFGDGVYEVIPSYSGHLFHFQDHLQRLENSLAGIRSSKTEIYVRTHPNRAARQQTAETLPRFQRRLSVRIGWAPGMDQ